MKTLRTSVTGLVALFVIGGVFALAGCGGSDSSSSGSGGGHGGGSLRSRISARISSLRHRNDIPDRHLTGTSCQKLAATADAISAEVKTPNDLIRELGHEVAGIHPGVRAIGDLAKGGRNIIPGVGFKNLYNDHTPGQARHFSGVAFAASYGGDKATRLVSIFARRDPDNSPDGQLTERALDFVKGLKNGTIPIDGAGDWIRKTLCRPDPASADSSSSQ